MERVKNNLAYCCEDFMDAHTVKNDKYFPKIKIVKLSGKLHFYWTVEPMKNKSIKETKKLEIYYCPYCGKKLSRFYKSDKYVDENEDE